MPKKTITKSSKAKSTKVTAKNKTPSLKQVIKNIVDLFKSFGEADYIGEPVSIIEHSLQAAYCAQKAKCDEEMILGSLFHDIGHIIAIADEKKGIRVVENMAGCGAKNHENIGGDYL